jgi:hypothetical protein
MITLKTKRDIINSHKDRKGNVIVLAKKGETLDLIADHVNILIVKKGEDRFHVRREDVEVVNN